MAVGPHDREERGEQSRTVPGHSSVTHRSHLAVREGRERENGQRCRSSKRHPLDPTQQREKERGKGNGNRTEIAGVLENRGGRHGVTGVGTLVTSGLGEGGGVVDGAWKTMPWSVVGLPAAVGVRGDGSGSPKRTRWCRAAETALKALF